MKTPLFLLILAATVAVSACRSRKKAAGEAGAPVTASAADTTAGDTLFVSLRRSPCFGTCPVYEIRIYRSGYVVYEAKRFLDSLGVFSTRLPEEKLKQIKDYALQIGYFDRKDSYDDQYVTDLPSTYTTCNFDGKKKSINNRYEGPRELASFEKLIDSMLEGVKWKRLKPAGE